MRASWRLERTRHRCKARVDDRSDLEGEERGEIAHAVAHGRDVDPAIGKGLLPADGKGLLGVLLREASQPLPERGQRGQPVGIVRCRDGGGSRCELIESHGWDRDGGIEHGRCTLPCQAAGLHGCKDRSHGGISQGSSLLNPAPRRALGHPQRRGDLRGSQRGGFQAPLDVSRQLVDLHQLGREPGALCIEACLIDLRLLDGAHNLCRALEAECLPGTLEVLVAARGRDAEGFPLSRADGPRIEHGRVKQRGAGLRCLQRAPLGQMRRDDGEDRRIEGFGRNLAFLDRPHQGQVVIDDRQGPPCFRTHGVDEPVGLEILDQELFVGRQAVDAHRTRASRTFGSTFPSHGSSLEHMFEKR